MKCHRCGQSHIKCIVCGEDIVGGQEYVCDETGRIIPMGHTHSQYLCGQNGLTMKMYNDIQDNKEKEKKEKKDWKNDAWNNN